MLQARSVIFLAIFIIKTDNKIAKNIIQCLIIKP